MIARLVLVTLLVASTPVEGAVAFDANCTAGSATGTSITFACAPSAGATVLVVAVADRAATVTGCTYNTVAMTEAPGSPFQAGSQGRLSVWSLGTPASGAHNVVCSLDASTRIVAGGHSYTGSDNVDPFRFKAASTSSPSSVVIGNTLATSLVADFWVAMEGAGTITVGGGQTQRWNLKEPAAGAGDEVQGGSSTKAAGGDVVMAWSPAVTILAAFEIAAPQPPPTAPTGVELDAYGGSTGLSCPAPASAVTTSVSQVARTGNLSTLTVANTGSFFPNQKIVVSGTTPDGGSFNTASYALATIRSKTASTLVYKQSGSDVSTTASSGTVRLARHYFAKVGSRWWGCTPLGHAIQYQGIFDIALDSGADYQGINSNSYALAKYATGLTTSASLNWAKAVVTRMQRWGFNLIGEQGTVETVKPTSVDSLWPTTDSTIPVHLNFVGFSWPSHYAQSQRTATQTQSAKGFAYAVKRSVTEAPASSSNNFYRQADPFDADFANWLTGMETDVAYTQQWVRGPNNDFLAFFVIDDGDSVRIDKGGVDYPTYYGGSAQTYPGNANFHYGYMTLIAAPVMTGRGDGTYDSEVGVPTSFDADPTFAAKAALITWLQQAGNQGPNYASITALNTAWGAHYTGFASTATNRSEAICAGQWNGTKTSCTLTAANTPITPHTIQVTVNAATKRVGDDAMGPISPTPSATGSLVGDDLTGTNTVNYTTGAVTVTFAVAPPTGATVNLVYQTGGWGVGTGLADEDGTCPSKGANPCWIPNDPYDLCGAHANWAGTFCTNSANVTAAFRADLDHFLGYFAATYYGVIRTELAKASVAPGVPYVGTTNATGYGSPPRAPVLAAMTSKLDAITGLTISDGTIVTDQARFDFMAANGGDLPMLQWIGMPGNPESYFSPYAAPTFPFPATNPATQAARATFFDGYLTRMRTFTDTTYGATHYVGYRFWQWQDQRSELTNWGVVTPRDDAYDGYEARGVLGRDPDGYPTGCFNQGTAFCEQGTYGDFLTGFARTNAGWLNFITRPLRTGAR